jgi:hypothetical protein
VARALLPLLIAIGLPNPLPTRAAVAYTNSLLEGRFCSHQGDFAGHPHSSTPVGRLRQIGYVRQGR